MQSKASYRFVVWQTVTLTLLLIGYAGYYLCRSDLSVALPMIAAEFSRSGMDPSVARIRLGGVASLGVLAYAIGKFASGSIADFLGGRRNFLFGMGGAVLFTVLFSLAGGLPLLTLSWIGNRAFQSLGWAGMVKIASRWFSYSSYGTAMGLISLSFLFGDAASRSFLAVLIAHGFTWRQLFLAAAAVLAVLLALNFIFLRESPSNVGEPEPRANPLNVFGEDGEKPMPAGLRALLAPLFRSWAFWIVCLLSLFTTLVRETFSLWTPTYFVQMLHLSDAVAAQRSALIPVVAGIGVIVAGWLSDRLGRGGRALIICGGLLAAAGVLMVLANLNPAAPAVLAVALVAVIAFLVIGPYSYLAGAISLDFGGKYGSATASGYIDSVGYFGGVFAGDGIARVSVGFGWAGVFVLLAIVCFLGSIAGGFYYADQRRARA